MKRLLLVSACSAVAACAADLSAARTVYVLSMSRGIDQYLANRLTNQHVFQVVTDPKKADVIFTDRLGEGFQSQLDTIFPPPAPKEDAKPAAKDQGAKDQGAKDQAKEKQDDLASAELSPFAKPVNALGNANLTSTFGRGKGTFFLVDAKSREVLWSVYQPSRSTSGKDLDHTATEIVNRLKKDLGMK